MILKKPVIAAVAASALLLLGGGTGCSQLRAHVGDGAADLLHCKHAEKQAPEIVAVGGQVHEPQKITIGTDGLTLRRALMSAGGARELTVSAASSTFSPGLAAKLSKLTELARTVGEYQTDRGALARADRPKDIIPLTFEELTEASNQANRDIDVLMTGLPEGIKKPVEQLRERSEVVGQLQERLRLKKAWPEFTRVPRETLEENLRQAIEVEKKTMDGVIKSGGAGASLRSIRTELLVALQRPSIQPPVTYYFPYDLVIAGLAGDIELQDRDAIDLVDVRDTALNPQFAMPAGSSTSVAIAGYVEKPGIQEGISMIGAVHAQSERTIDDPRSVWMLVRPSLNGLRSSVFVLPDRLVLGNGAAADAPTQQGDVYKYLILPQVPIVYQTLLQRVKGAEKQGHLEKLKARKAQHRQNRNRSNPLLRNSRAGVSAATSPIRSVLPLR